MRVSKDDSIQREILKDPNGEFMEINKIKDPTKSTHIGFVFDNAALALAKFQELCHEDRDAVENAEAVKVPVKPAKKAWPLEGTITFVLKGGIWIEFHWGSFLAAHE
ncbi:MAG TPA: hypothetical protein VGE62_02685 [Candidatus Paceibacterota bacterium]